MKNMPQTTIREVPVQDTRQPVKHEVHFTAEADDFLKAHIQGRGSIEHVLNHIVLSYRDALPPSRRGALNSPAADAQPAKLEPSAKKTGANG